jgi:hypothetical protein
VSTAIGAALEDGIGIIVFTNADSKAEPISNIILEAAEKAFGSGNSSSSSPATVTRRSNPPVPRHAGVTARVDGGPHVDLTGTYCNAGYGSPVLCSVHSSSPSCKSVLDAFRSIDPSLSPNSTSIDLFASWAMLLSTHVRFIYTNDSNYLVSIGSIYPHGYGKNSTPFSTLAPSVMAEFVVENDQVVGFGLNGVGDDDNNDDVKRAGSVQETSEVWFIKET